MRKKIEQLDDFKLKETNGQKLQPNNLEKGFIKKLQIESMEDVLHVTIRIKGLWKKNYSILIHNNRLMISALCRANKHNDSFITYTDSFLLPTNVYSKGIWSDILNGELHIIIAKQISGMQQNYEEMKLGDLSNKLGMIFKN